MIVVISVSIMLVFLTARCPPPLHHPLCLLLELVQICHANYFVLLIMMKNLWIGYKQTSESGGMDLLTFMQLAVSFSLCFALNAGGATLPVFKTC